MMTRRMKRLMVASSIGLLVSGSVHLYTKQLRSTAAEAATRGTMLVATLHVPANTPLEAKHFKAESRPFAYIAPGAIRSPETVIGRQAKWDLVPGDPITEQKLVKPGNEGARLLPIPKGKRAVTVKVDEFVGVAGFVKPNSIVDVVATWDLGGSSRSKVILQNIQVLAVAQAAKHEQDAMARGNSSVTLAVTPDESEKLILGAERGNIRLAMRSPEEILEIQTSGTTPAALTGELPKPAEVSPVPKRIPWQKPEPAAVVILRGNRSEEVLPL